MNSVFEADVGAYTRSLSEVGDEMTMTATALREIATPTNGRSTIMAAAAKEASADGTTEVSASVNEISLQVAKSKLVARRPSRELRRRRSTSGTSSRAQAHSKSRRTDPLHGA